MFTEVEYEKFIKALENGMPFVKACIVAGVDPKSMREAIDKVPEVKEFIDGILNKEKIKKN